MLSIALSLYFYNTTVLSTPNFTFYPLAFLHQILNHGADEYHSAILANFSDLSNVCNKTSMSLTNFTDHCTVKGPKYIADIFLCSPLKMTTKRDDAFLQLILRYTRLISTKYFHKDTGCPGEILQLIQSCREYCLSEFVKTDILS